MRQAVIVIMIGLFTSIGILLVAGNGQGYDEYTDSQCASCHDGFVNRGSLHRAHEDLIQSNCGMCHPGNPGSKPVSTWSADDNTAFSCLGCHGRDYGGSIGRQAAGLRLHHANAIPPVACFGCHPSDPTPLAESILPPHYSRGDVNIATSCQDGLDNDGDFDYDANDPDCGVPVEPVSWGVTKARF